MKEFIISEAKVETAVLVGLITPVSYTHLFCNLTSNKTDQYMAVSNIYNNCLPLKEK